ncbi:MAG: MBL fold hydrolase [Methanobacteriales archaeon HGW-Methanobacteriales-1]|jgi:flavorubredoxin|nr:MAG: MBL fold hydrolase [Methanobacteriales archaeon HGW-Methanobacteriales-1]
MAVRIIKSGIYSVGAIDWDRQLFDELIPLPQGTSYNSYIVEGTNKTALIDTVDPTKTQELLDNLDETGLTIDYIISNHAEQDHSGSIPAVLEKFPDAVIVTNPQCEKLLKSFFELSNAKLKVIGDGETLSLGDKTLKFIFTPWVHWPDTMVTYAIEDEILFSCDFFGSHLATSELFGPEDMSRLIPSKRYYAEIMMPFRPMILNNLKKIEGLEIEIIGPSHGPLISNPTEIMNLYAKWASNETSNQVVLPYVSMHGSTEIMVKYLIDALIKRGIEVKPFNLSKMDLGEFLIDLVDSSTLVISAPTVLTKPHPFMAQILYLVNVLRPKLKYGAIIGSYGWGTMMEDEVKGLLNNLNINYHDTLLIKGLPKEEDFKKLDDLADQILETMGN